MPDSLAGKTCIVTGASRGIGFAIAEGLVAKGVRVVITARREADLDRAVAKLGGNRNALAVAGTVDDPIHRREAVTRAVDKFGSVDLLVNNTGINPSFGSLTDLDLGMALRTVEVNCIATLGWIQTVHQTWMAEHGGSIVNITSVSGIRPSPGIAFYGATKAMLGHITRSLALELAPTVRVNAVAPAVVKTRFATALYEGREAELSGTYPLQRLGEPRDVSSAVIFLLSDASAWITGQELIVDGGKLLVGAR